MHTIFTLPNEILWRVVYHATNVDGAFETEAAQCQRENREAIPQSIRESMSTKTSLSLVSIYFHELSEEYLFEIIVIKAPDQIRPLVELLRRANGDRPKRGWWCRRLEIDLSYTGYTWAWGKFTLWGLIPACPRLSDLRCCIKHMDHHPPYAFGKENLTLRFPVSETLLQLIASTYGTALRRVELAGQITITFDLAERLLSHLESLTSCRLLGLLPRDHPIYRGGSQTAYEEACILQDAIEFEEYELARETTHWPARRPTSSSDHVLHLPHLHTLDILHFTAAIRAWDMPCLSVVTAGIAHPTGSPETRAAEISIGLRSRAASIRQLICYANASGGIDIWLIAVHLPNLEILEYYMSAHPIQSRPSAPLEKLRSLGIYRTYPRTDGYNEFVKKLHGFIGSGLLPALERVRVTGMSVGRKGMQPVLAAEFGSVGVKLEFETASADVGIRVYQ